MVSNDQVNELKGRCKKDKSNPELNVDLEKFMENIGFDLDTTNPDYILERKTINQGAPFQTDAYCLKQMGGRLDKTEFYERLNILKEYQGKLPETFKINNGGFGFDKNSETWCSTSPNVIEGAIKLLKEKKGLKTKPMLDFCDFTDGVPKYYREYQGELEIKSKGESFEENPTKEPQENESQEKKKLNAVIPDQSTEVFIPLDMIDREDVWKIENAIREDGMNKKSDMLVTYYTQEYDQMNSRKVDVKHVLLNQCNRYGKRGLCAPIGLANNVKTLFGKRDFDLDIDDQRKLPPAKPFDLNPIIKDPNGDRPLQVRNYQQDIINEAEEKGTGIVEVATGGGKTIIASGIIGKIGQDTDFIVPNNSLFYNAKTQIGSYVPSDKVNIGQVGGMNVDFKDDPNKLNINIISLPLASLAISNPDRIDPKKRDIVLKALKHANNVIFDETHHIPAETYQRVAQYTPAKYRFGLSATPFRDDGKTLEIVAGVGGTLGHKIRAQDLIKQGFLTPPEIYVVDNDDIDPSNDREMLENLEDEACKINPQTKMYKLVKQEHRMPSVYPPEGKTRFRYIEKASVECNKPRNERIVDLAKKLDQYDKTKVIFVASVEHGKKLQDMLENQGIYSEILTGDTESDILPSTEKEIEEEEEKEKEFNKKRTILFEKMKKGQLKTIIATDKIMGEGVDIPAIDSLILTDMRKSRVSAIQMVGRALRKKEGKKEAIIFDFDDPVDYLKTWEEKRHEVWRNEEYPIEPIAFEDVDKKLESRLGKPSADISKRKSEDERTIRRKTKQREYTDMKVTDLKLVAKNKGIKITGLKKPDLISRLMEKES